MNVCERQLEEVYSGIDYDQMYKKPQFFAEDVLTYEFIQRKLFGYVLDIGCGTGCALENLIISNNRYIGVDLCQTMIDRAKEKFPGYLFEKRDGKDIKGKFDTIINLYGGYFDAYDIIRMLRFNLSKEGFAFFHIDGGHRKQTPVRSKEDSVGIPSYPYNSRMIEVLSTHFKIKALKLNAYSEKKEWIKNSRLYELFLRAESGLPIPTDKYTWILLQLSHR